MTTIRDSFYNIKLEDGTEADIYIRRNRLVALNHQGTYAIQSISKTFFTGYEKAFNDHSKAYATGDKEEIASTKAAFNQIAPRIAHSELDRFSDYATLTLIKDNNRIKGLLRDVVAMNVLNWYDKKSQEHRAIKDLLLDLIDGEFDN